MTSKVDVANLVKVARKEVGMTQSQLAALVGTDKANISRLESGRYNPSLEFLLKVTNGLGKNLEIQIN